MAKTAPRTAPQDGNSARMELRISPSSKALIQRAMAISGRSAAELAFEGAQRVLLEHERMTVAGRDRDAFLNAMRNPLPPTKRLVAALRRHDKLTR